jgi:hypothetical protein
MESTTEGSDLLEVFKSTLRRLNLKFNNLSGVVRDRMPAAMRKGKGLVVLIRKKADVCVKMAN